LIRQPVVVVLGHVDSGKTTLLDKIRGTAVAAREVGSMTQHIGASFFPIETLKQICGPLIKAIGGELKVPGLLVIDTPGHEVFTNLRIRGGSAADIAILVVDVTRGFEVQTYESIEILRARKVPFVVALNKIDLIPGWKKSSTNFITKSIKIQDESVINELDIKIYEVVGTLSRLGFRSEAFNRVKDFAKEVAIVPVSAKSGEGIPELLMVLIGLTQRFLTKRLEVGEGPARGIILEVREEVGLGNAANVILLDGVLRVGDLIVVAKREGAIVTKVRALLMPKPLDEMRDPRDKFSLVNKVVAAAGVKITSPDLEGVLAGSPLYGIKEERKIEKIKEQVINEVSSVFISTDKLGVIVKADTIGSLEAIIDMLRKKGVPIRIADIGPISKREVTEASIVKEKDRLLGCILAFGVRIYPDAEEESKNKDIKIFTENVVYSLIENYLSWVEGEKRKTEEQIFRSITPPCKFKVLEGFVFRRSNPAIFGIEVLVGRLRQKARVMNDGGNDVGTVHQIQDRGKNIDEALQGMQVAISMQEPMVGRQVKEGQILYTVPREEEVKLLKERFFDKLEKEELDLLEEIVKIRRKVSPLYGY
jgi:translation initiation factor 5B